jgi:hypothetical protein
MEMPAAVVEWCERVLGAGVSDVFFSASSMSSVRGVLLDDGRRVAVKVRDGSRRVMACAHAQRLATAAGIDCPALLAGPALLDPAAEAPVWVSAEQWRPEGTGGPPPQPAVAYTDLAHRLVAALNDPSTSTGQFTASDYAPPPPWAAYDHAAPGRTFPPVSSPRWDPERDIVPAEYRRLAAAARDRLRSADLPWVLGHSDLNGHNVKWVGSHPVVHDWDSIVARPEAVLAGILAVNHVELPGRGAITPLAESDAALGLYQERRPMTSDEVEVAWAAGVWVAAYNASFEYLHGSPGQVAEQILVDGWDRLRLAGC